MRKGEHVYVYCLGYTHHGIDCGDGTIIHYTGELLQGVIRRSSKESFASDKVISVQPYEQCDPPGMVIQRAESRLGEDKYDLIFNNCEHFATWCKTGKSESYQVRNAATTATVAGIGFAGTAVFLESYKKVMNVTFQIPNAIAAGLADGSLERVGGIVRNSKSKKIVAWLREIKATPATGTNLLNIGATASVLNLGITVMGFVILNERLNQLEERLQTIETVLNQINDKIDLGFYANFRAALQLAMTATKTQNLDIRRGLAISAIDRLKQSDVVYTKYLDEKLAQKSRALHEYLLSLMLGYVAEARCYLEIGEPDLALEVLRNGSSNLRPRIQKYIDILLTSNPAVYLHPDFDKQISLKRLTKIYQWLDPFLTEGEVFERLRNNMYSLKSEISSESGYKWVGSLPAAIVATQEVKGSFLGNQEEMKQEAFRRLPKIMELMESLIESHKRFAAYQMEVKAIIQLNISFLDWMTLKPDASPTEDLSLICIVPDEPVAI